MSIQLATLKNGSKLQLKLSSFPPELQQVKVKVYQYRKLIEDWVSEGLGGIDLPTAHLIDVATTAHSHALICGWLISKQYTTMDASDVERCSGAIVKGKQQRNAAIKALSELMKPVDPWAAALQGRLLDPSVDSDKSGDSTSQVQS